MLDQNGELSVTKSRARTTLVLVLRRYVVGKCCSTSVSDNTLTL